MLPARCSISTRKPSPGCAPSTTPATVSSLSPIRQSLPSPPSKVSFEASIVRSLMSPSNSATSLYLESALPPAPVPTVASTCTALSPIRSSSPAPPFSESRSASIDRQPTSGSKRITSISVGNAGRRRSSRRSEACRHRTADRARHHHAVVADQPIVARIAHQRVARSVDVERADQVVELDQGFALRDRLDRARHGRRIRTVGHQQRTGNRGHDRYLVVADQLVVAVTARERVLICAEADATHELIEVDQRFGRQAAMRVGEIGRRTSHRLVPPRPSAHRPPADADRRSADRRPPRRRASPCCRRC